MTIKIRSWTIMSLNENSGARSRASRASQAERSNSSLVAHERERVSARSYARNARLVANPAFMSTVEDVVDHVGNKAIKLGIGSANTLYGNGPRNQIRFDRQRCLSGSHPKDNLSITNYRRICRQAMTS